MYKHVFRLGAAALAVSLLVACGGGGERVETPPNGGNNGFTPPPSGQSATGYFLDAAVAGVEVWQGGKKVSTTDRDGKFTFTAGQAAEFRIGKLVLGSTTPIEVVTPADLTRDADQTVTLLQLLQGLDADGQPDNGITISPATVQALEKLSKPVKAADSADIAALKQQLPGVAIKDVTEQQALEHFAKTNTAKHTSVADVAKRIQGYWRSECKSDNTQNIRQLRLSRPDTLEMVTRVNRTYAGANCTGMVVKTDNVSFPAGERTYKVLGHSIQSGKYVTTVLVKNRDDEEIEFFPWEGDNTIRAAVRVKSLNDWGTPAATGNTGGASTNTAMTAEKLVDLYTSTAWTSSCVPSERNYGEYKRYVHQSVKKDARTIVINGVVLRYDNATCAGSPARIEKDGEADTVTFEQPRQNNKGHWVFPTHGGGDGTFTLTSPTTFTLNYVEDGEPKTEHYTASSMAEFERLWKQAQ